MTFRKSRRSSTKLAIDKPSSSFQSEQLHSFTLNSSPTSLVDTGSVPRVFRLADTSILGFESSRASNLTSIPSAPSVEARFGSTLGYTTTFNGLQEAN